MFSGIGGFEYGMQKAYKRWSIKNQKQSQGISSGSKKGQRGKLSNQLDKGFHCVGYSEIESNAIKVYETHYPKNKNYGDCTKINWKKVPNFKLLVAGFPCQAFSLAGKRKGFEDTRGTLFFEIVRAIRIKKPKYILLENVKGLLSHQRGETYFIIKNTLEKLGYFTERQTLNSRYFGVPQNRERIFIVGYLGGTYFQRILPIQGRNIKPKKYHEQYKNPTIYFGDNRSYSKTCRGRVKKEITGALMRVGKPGGVYLNGLLRRLTPIEYERLQGFPDNWTSILKDKNRYECLGNAVTTNVVEEIIYSMLERSIR